MKVKKKDLVSGLEVLKRILPDHRGKAMLDTLRFVVFSPEKGKIQLSASTLEAKVFLDLPRDPDDGADVEEIAFDGPEALDLLKKMRSEELDLWTDKKHLHAVGGGSKRQIELKPLDDIPGQPKIETDGEMTVDPGAFSKLLSRAVIAASTDDTRTALTGILLEPEGPESLRAVATNGHWMSVEDLAAGWNFRPPLARILPRQAVVMVSALIKWGRDEEPLTVRVGPATDTSASGVVWFTISGERWTVKVREVEGQFPSYHQILDPTAKYKNSLPLDLEKTLEALDALPPVKDQKVHMIALKHTKTLLILANMVDRDAAQETVGLDIPTERKPPTGKNWSAGFNRAYLLDILRLFRSRNGAGKLDLYIKDPLTSVLFTDGEARAILMPVRTSDTE